MNGKHVDCWRCINRKILYKWLHTLNPNFLSQCGHFWRPSGERAGEWLLFGDCLRPLRDPPLVTLLLKKCLSNIILDQCGFKEVPMFFLWPDLPTLIKLECCWCSQLHCLRRYYPHWLWKLLSWACSELSGTRPHVWKWLSGRRSSSRLGREPGAPWQLRCPEDRDEVGSLNR